MSIDLDIFRILEVDDSSEHGPKLPLQTNVCDKLTIVWNKPDEVCLLVGDGRQPHYVTLSRDEALSLVEHLLLGISRAWPKVKH